MGVRSFSSAKNFGMVGAMFAGTECCIEGVNPLRSAPSMTEIISIILKKFAALVSCEERSQERNSRWMLDRRDTWSESRTTSRSYRMCRLRSFQRGH